LGVKRSFYYQNYTLIFRNPLEFKPNLILHDTFDADAILNELSKSMIFEVDATMKEDLDNLLKYDFDPKAENAAKSILNVYHYLAKSPEFQLI
jgi:hypothetical protein